MEYLTGIFIVLRSVLLFFFTISRSVDDYEEYKINLNDVELGNTDTVFV